MAKEAKEAKLSSILTKLRKDNSADFPNPKEAGVVKRIVTSSPKLNYIFGGGLPCGRIIELAGPPSGGKTVLSAYIGGEFQKRKDGGPSIVLFIDFEKTFDFNYASTAGLDCSDDKFIYMSPLTGEEAFTYCQELVQTGEIGLIILDSLAATPTSAQMEDEYGKSNFGSTARMFAEGLKKLNPYLSRYGVTFLILNQVRDKIGGFNTGYGPQETFPGGHAPKFYASWRGRVSKSEDIMDGQEIIGNMIKIKNIKSKIGIPKRSAELNLYYASGFNPDAEFLDFLCPLGIVEKKGGWYSNEEWGMKVQGQDKVLNFLYEHPDKFEEVKKIVNDMFQSYSKLDESETTEESEELIDSED